ncbi:copper resistance protein CopC [Actinotalea ferrariae]|uniref:copper resistance CopC family protein n=1 Tax=Actinotalea ferrariae TaxID=1386098 RepID=UPI001C8C487C|nr:copper resistance CopC family protein [Actinotalea ferrariae]MBX9243615.1 copper resistance protein CopC [Actinotalea ferrariae]
MAATAEPQPPPHARAAMRLARAGAVVVATLLLLLGWTPRQAVAHDALVSTEPGDGTTVEEPEAVVLTFAADQLAVGAVVAVTGPDGQEWGDGATTVSGVTVTQPLRDGLLAGDFQVAWRSVSGDGHPVEGTFGFTVEAAPESPRAPEPSPSEPATSPSPAAAAAPEQPGSSAGVPGPDRGEPEDRGGSSIGAPTAVGLAIAAAIVAVGGAVFLRRRSGGERRTEP